MKISKRIFVCLIVLVISVSMLSLSAFAQEPAELKYTPENHRTILEYFIEPIIFDMDFESEAVGSGYKTDKLVQLNNRNKELADSFASIVEDGSGNKYLSVSATGTSSVNAYLNWSAEEGANIDDFLLNFSVMASGTGSKIVDLVIKDAPITATQVANGGGTTLISIDFTASKVNYYDRSEIGANAELDITTDTFYNVSLNYSVIDGNYDFTVSTADGTELLSVTDMPLPYESIGNVRLGSGYRNMMNSTVAFDNVTASGGSFIRYESQKTADIERAISDFIAIVSSDSYTLDQKLEILDTAYELILDCGVSGSTEEAQADVIAIQRLGVFTYLNEVTARLDLLTDSLDYNRRVAILEECVPYVELIPDDVSYMGDELAYVEAALASFEQSYGELDRLEEHSLAVISALADIDLNNDNIGSYSYIKSYYDAIADYTPYLGYSGVAAVINQYNTVFSKYAELTEKGNSFVTYALAAADMDNGFGQRYEAFVKARENYFEDTALSGVTEALAAYQSVEAEMNTANEICEHFLLNVSRAYYSQYLAAKKSALDAASRGAYEEGAEAPAVDTQLNVVKEKYLEYPGIPASIALYEELVLSVIADEQAALEYVNTVKALEAVADTLTKEELSQRIAEAEEKQQSGNIVGFDGVTEANTALNNLKSKLELTKGYKELFNELVGQIQSAEGAYDIFNLSKEAYSVIESAEKYEGVEAADVERLTAKVNAYNETIRALNAGFKDANTVACNTVSSVSGSASDDTAVGIAAFIIKKFYE